MDNMSTNNAQWLTVKGRTLVIDHDASLVGLSGLSKVCADNTSNVLCVSEGVAEINVGTCKLVSTNAGVAEELPTLLKIFKPGNVLVSIKHPELTHIHKLVSAAKVAVTAYAPNTLNQKELQLAQHANYVWVTQDATKQQIAKSGVNAKNIISALGPAGLQSRLKEIASHHPRILLPKSEVNSAIVQESEISKATASGSAAPKHPSNVANHNQLAFEPTRLSNNPEWKELAVQAGGRVTIHTMSEYLNSKDKQRKAVVLIQCFTKDGKKLDTVDGRLAFSKYLKSHFKYLPCTNSKSEALYSFKVPAGVHKIKVGFRSFNANNGEQIELKKAYVDFEPPAQPDQFIPPSKQAAEMSILGWPEHKANGKPYVIGVMDEFTTGCFEEDLNLIQPRPDNWYALAEKYKPELFFIESAWKGNFGSWQYRVADYANKPGPEISHMCQYAKQKGIPTLFWNKEDPVHHDKFMCSAELADYIFTTDANMIPSYQAKTGNDKVFALPFAAQPALHKPAPLAGRKKKSCFAGSWYGERHGERAVVMRWLLEAANRHGLEIYDRNHGTGIFPFPEEYHQGIKGSLPYKELCDEYSRYRVFLNVNSVTDSPTMFARRVFELMASGTPVVSTAAKGIEELFESDAVWLVHSAEEAEEAICTLMTDDKEWRRRSLAGIREVFSRHTYAHRLNDIFANLGLSTRLTTDPQIALLAAAANQHELNALEQFASKQAYANFKLAVTCKEGFKPSKGQSHQAIQLIEPEAQQSWLQAQNASLTGVVSPLAHYGDHYLRDLANASIYQPEAEGWAKALDEDAFSFNTQASQYGTIWKAKAFMDKQLFKQSSMQPSKQANSELKQSSLFVADSDEFKLVGGA